MKDTEKTKAQIAYAARVMRRFAPPKKWTWRRKFAFILENEGLRRENAVRLFPDIEGLDFEAVIDSRRARERVTRLLRTSVEPYRDFIRRLEDERDRLAEVESIAFLAHFDLLLYRLRHLDTPL